MRIVLKSLAIVVAVLVMNLPLFATSEVSSGLVNPPVGSNRTIPTLDDQCVITFIGYTYGSYTGETYWPGGGGTYRLTGFCFESSCTPGVPLCTYCTDLNHSLYTSPYCVDINPLVVRPEYPEQYPALAYIMTWYQVTNDQTDRIKQLAVWKLSNDTRDGFPSIPLYYIDAGRGYPSIGDTPVFPFVNTAYNTDPLNNDPANVLVLDAIGYGPDGLAKNVILCNDQLLVAYDPAQIEDGLATVPVTLQLVRGSEALAVGNTSLSGVRILITVDNGVLSAAEAWTNSLGQVYFTLTQPVGTALPSNLRVCTYGTWPESVIPCDTLEPHQQLLVQQQASGSACSLCVNAIIPPDQFLSAELASFTAAATPLGIELNWRTASEQNTDLWEVERRVTGSGTYSLLAQVAAENRSTGAHYRYLDRTAAAGSTYDYRLVDVDVGGHRTTHEQFVVTEGRPGTANGLVSGYELFDNYPNPFNPETAIRFNVAETGLVSLKVYDLSGHEVASLLDGEVSAGEHSVTFDAAALPSGMYFYVLKASLFTATKKMVLMK